MSYTKDKTERLNVRVAPDIKVRLAAVSEATGLPAAHIARIAVVEKVEELEGRTPPQPSLAPIAALAE